MRSRLLVFLGFLVAAAIALVSDPWDDEWLWLGGLCVACLTYSACVAALRSQNWDAEPAEHLKRDRGTMHVVWEAWLGGFLPAIAVFYAAILIRPAAAILFLGSGMVAGIVFIVGVILLLAGCVWMLWQLFPSSSRSDQATRA